MKTKSRVLSLFFLFFLATNVHSTDDNRTRLIILADMGNEPDEVQQMVHMVINSNEFFPEALIAVTGKYLRPESNEAYRRVTHPELFHDIINAYAKAEKNLRKHATGWHSAKYLRSIVAAGQSGYGFKDIGTGKASAGSKLIEKAFERKDDRPIWIVVNAGSNTLGQALFDYENKHTKVELKHLLSKLRVFENGAQDNAGAWILNKYPEIHWIRSNYQTYAYGGPGGVDGDLTVNLGPHFWGQFEYSVSGQNDWLKKHVMKNHGPLGAAYPERRYHGFRDGGLGFMEGGGTIPWIGLVNKGLFSIDNPGWGGWGGRFTNNKVAGFWSRHKDISKDEKQFSPFYVYREASDIWTNPRDKKTYHGDYVPVWRWREAMYNNMVARMDWTTQPYDKANHHPVAAFHNNKENSIIRMKVSPGEEIDLDATLSTDPDGDKLDIHWWVYQEAGTYAGQVFISDPFAAKSMLKIPSGAANKQIHLILEVKDQNKIVTLFDYRRIVLDVSNTYRHSSISRQTD